MRRTDVILAARSLVGTPFRWRGRRPGVGLDCAGVLAATCASVGYPHADVRDYPKNPPEAILVAALLKWMDPVNPRKALPGDFGAMRWDARDGEARHLVVLTDVGAVHALAVPPRRVVETHLSADQLGRVAHAFRMRGIDAWRP